MESLKYCLVLATLIGYVVANPTPKKIGSFSDKSPYVEGKVFYLNETTLKIRDYRIKYEDEDNCQYHFYVGSNGTSITSFLQSEKLTSAQSTETEFDLHLNQTKAEDIDWLLIGCDYNGEPHRLAYVKFPENLINDEAITDGNGSSSLRGLLTNLALALLLCFLMK